MTPVTPQANEAFPSVLVSLRVGCHTKCPSTGGFPQLFGLCRRALKFSPLDENLDLVPVTTTYQGGETEPERWNVHMDTMGGAQTAQKVLGHKPNPKMLNPPLVCQRAGIQNLESSVPSSRGLSSSLQVLQLLVVVILGSILAVAIQPVCGQGKAQIGTPILSDTPNY